MRFKSRQKNVNKFSEGRKYNRGEKTCWDISAPRKTSAGGKKFWNLIYDVGTEMTFSIFLKRKSDLAKEGVRFIKRSRNRYGVQFKTIRCDNAGENRGLEKEIDALLLF